MRISYYFAYIFIIAISVLGCDCKDCINNLSNYNKSLPYKNGDTVHFYNDLQGELIDTVKFFYNPVEDTYCNKGKETTMDCSGYIEMSIGNYVFTVTQEPNFYGNTLTFADRFNNEQLNHGCLECKYFYNIKDTIDYNYRGNYLKAYVHLFARNDLEGVAYCSSYITSEDKKLLQYIIKINSSEYIWKLK